MGFDPGSPGSHPGPKAGAKPLRHPGIPNSYLSIVTPNMNGLNDPIKRCRVSDWIEKQDPSICCLQETHFRPEDTFRLRVRGWRTIYHATGSQKKAGVAILISDKLDFKLKAVTRDEEGHYIIITGSIHQEELNIINGMCQIQEPPNI